MKTFSLGTHTTHKRLIVAKVTPHDFGWAIGRALEQLMLIASSGRCTTVLPSRELSSLAVFLSTLCTTVDCEDVDEVDDDIDVEETAEDIEIEDEQVGGSFTLLLLLLLLLLLIILSTHIDEDECLAGAAPPNEARCCLTST